MLRLTKSSFIDSEKYLSDLKQLNFVYIEPETIKNRIANFENEVITLYYLCGRVLRNETGGNLVTPKSLQILKYLVEYLNCPKSFLIDKATDNLSLNSKKVIEPIMSRGYAIELLTLYKMYTSKKKLLGDLKGYITRMSESDKKDKDGNVLYKLYFNYEPKVNLRVSTNNSNIQSMPKSCCDCMHAPEGYTIVTGDFEQSDLKIAYNLMLKDESNYDIMMKYDDKYEGFARILLGEEFDLEQFKLNRKVYKLNSLAPLYGAQSGGTELSTAFIKKANRYLATSERYQENLRRINRRIDLGFPLKVTSYFGHSELVSVNKDGKKFIGTNPITFSLNSPIQTGTSEVLKACTNQIMSEFEELGYTSENGAIYSYLNRHDEALFLVRNDLLEYSWIFQKNQIILVDDWTPLNIKFSYQTEYTVENEELDAKAKKYYKPEYDEVQEVSLSKDNYYIPCKDILELNIGSYYCEELDSTIISYHDIFRNTCSFEVLSGNDEDRIMKSVENRLANCKSLLEKLDADSVLATYKKIIGWRDSFCGYLIRMSGSVEQSMSLKADVIAEYGAYKIATKNGLDFIKSGLLVNSEEFVKGVIANGEVFDD